MILMSDGIDYQLEHLHIRHKLLTYSAGDEENGDTQNEDKLIEKRCIKPRRSSVELIHDKFMQLGYAIKDRASCMPRSKPSTEMKAYSNVPSMLLSQMGGDEQLTRTELLAMVAVTTSTVLVSIALWSFYG